jgi:hypothetical protein
MTTEERDQLLTDSEQVRDETVNKANTATRVGTLFRNIVNFAYNIYGDIPEQSEQFNTVAGITYLSDVSRKYTTSVIDFTYNGHYGTTVLPIYDSFTFNEASIIQGNKNKKVEMFLSCDTVPSIISSPPAFLAGNITGTILTGYENLNLLSFELKMVYNETTDVFEPKVLLTITQGANANEDPSPPVLGDPDEVILMRFNENDDPPQPDSLINESINSDLFIPNLSNASTASYIDLGGGEYALEMGTNSNTVASRADITFDLDSEAVTKMSGNELTIICRTEFLTLSTEQVRSFFASRDDVGLTGINFLMTLSIGRMDCNYYDNTGVTRGMNSSVNLPIIPLTNGQWVFAVRFWVEGGLTRVRHYFKSSANGYNFQQLGTERTNVNVPALGHNKINLTKLSDVASTSRPERRSYMQVITRAITEAELETIINEID